MRRGSLELALGALRAPVDFGPLGDGRWWTLLELPAESVEGTFPLELHGIRAGGPAMSVIGSLELTAADSALAPPPPSIVVPGGTPLIAVCMATHEPDPERLALQLESIQAQTWPAWICVISDDASSPERFAELQRLTADDERFVVSRSESRRGFYGNFERALRMAPVEAGFIALSDQDDLWYEDKLTALHATVSSGPQIQLAYSDMRILDEHGELVSDTYWILRRNRCDLITSLLVANTVTGAAALFRRQVLDDALPFPPPVAEPYHDHWLALCALARGELAYLDRPTYDRVRHLRSVTAGTAHARALRRLQGRELDGEGIVVAPSARATYRDSYLQLAQFARILEVRIGDRISPSKRGALRRFVSADRSLSGPLWLALRSLRSLLGRNETMGRERALAASLIWRRLQSLTPRRCPSTPEDQAS